MQEREGKEEISKDNKQTKKTILQRISGTYFSNRVLKFKSLI